MVFSLIAAILIALTVVAVLRLIFRQSHAQDLSVDDKSISEEVVSTPVGAWAGVIALAVLAVIAGYFAWGRPQGPPRVGTPDWSVPSFTRSRPEPSPSPSPAPSPSLSPSPSPGASQARPSRGGLQGFLNWLRPRPRPAGPAKRTETVTPAPEAEETEPGPPSSDDGKPGSPDEPSPSPILTPVPPPPAPVPAKAPEPVSRMISDPVWIHRPGPADIARFYPDGAKGRAGAAVLECLVGPMGRLRGCHVLVENPRGSGFGSAAMRVAYTFRMRETTRSGEPTRGRTVRVPVTFAPSS